MPLADPVLIRPAQPGDHEAWLAMRRALWPFAQPDEMVSELPAMLANPEQTAFIAETASGRLVGLIELAIRGQGLDGEPDRHGLLEGW